MNEPNWSQIDRDRIAALEAENAELKVNAEFGMQCYQDRCEGAYIEVSVVKRLEAENKRLKNPKVFKVQRYGTVPWYVGEVAYGAYAARFGYWQSMERLNERGGFAVDEMDDLYPEWRTASSEITILRAELAALEADVTGWKNQWTAADANVIELLKENEKLRIQHGLAINEALADSGKVKGE